MTLLSHPQVLEAFGPLMPCSDKAEGEHRLCCNGMCEAARPHVENAITAILTALQAGEDGLDFEAARVSALREDWESLGEVYHNHFPWEKFLGMDKQPGVATLRVALDRQHRAIVGALREQLRLATIAESTAEAEANDLRQEIATLRVDIADVKAKEECRPHAISSTSLRNAVQHLYRHLGDSP